MQASGTTVRAPGLIYHGLPEPKKGRSPVKKHYWQDHANAYDDGGNDACEEPFHYEIDHLVEGHFDTRNLNRLSLKLDRLSFKFGHSILLV